MEYLPQRKYLYLVGREILSDNGRMSAGNCLRLEMSATMLLTAFAATFGLNSDVR